jgi:hypothetical protein
MSNTHRAAFAAITIALLPAVSRAERPEHTAARACAEAFVTTLGSAGKPAPRLKGTNFYGIDDMLGAPSEITLYAVDPHSGVTVARASCELSPAGKIVSLKAMPL